MSVLQAFREKLKGLGVDAFIIGSGDAHQSEYVHESEMRRAFISNFTGSAGTCLVLSSKNEAYLWTDGRYFLQASQELSSDWTLMRSGEPTVLELNDWLTMNLKSGSVIGVDPSLMSNSQAKSLEKQLQGKGMVLKAVDSNPVDAIWASSRPAVPNSPITVHPMEYAGVHHSEKIAKVQKELEKTNSVGFVVSMLDEVVWLFNIRGSDVSFNPVVISYAVVTKSGAHLFVDQSKVIPGTCAHLSGVQIHSYEEIEHFLRTLAKEGSVAADPTQLNWRLYNALGSNAKDIVSPITLMKAIKNESEIRGIRDSHRRDGAALTAFLHYLEKTVKAGGFNGSISEFEVTEKLEEFRGKIANHVSPSFSTIAGFASNGAIIHYKPEKASAAHLSTQGMFLLDSGAQYLDGTTDVTRTVHFGQPTEHMKRCYTLVLKGHIALARLVFPEGTLGSRLDCVARMPLWTAGLDYNHGTGHGVGAYLNVHEGPQGIGFRKRENEVGFYPGMTISNEPGYYEEGQFGIRVETVCVTVEANTDHHFAGRKFCKLETVTMAPIKTNLIDIDLLDDGELEWLNTYHSEVRTSLQPLMSQLFPESLDFLVAETEPLLRTKKRKIVE